MIELSDFVVLIVILSIILFSVMHRLHFDRFMPRFKVQDRQADIGSYTEEHYWYNEPLALLVTEEKRSDCFVHDNCHQLGLNQD